MKQIQVKNFPDYYVSDSGIIYSKHRSGYIELKPWVVCGYKQVCLSKNGKKYHKLIHRIVAESFISNPKKLPEVNHKNGKRYDNRVENLEWVTREENQLHSWKFLNRKPACAMKGKLGEKNNLSKLVFQIKNNKIIAKFYGTKEAERQTGINSGNIRMCCLGKRLSAGNYQWKYK
ncbi:MAG: HNH endonuclease [Clostridia bacterium]|nr:HNH endonuclease [Clostridia bacterium]